MSGFKFTTARSDQFNTNEESRYSRYGAPVKFAITFEGGNYLVYDSQGKLLRKRYNSFLIPLTAVTSFRRSTRRTRVLETTEQYLPTSWVIDIQGVMFNDESRTENSRADEQKRQLMLWDNIADTILISGKGFEELDISEIEITYINIGQYVGKENTIPFSIRAESHIPYEVQSGTGNG
jgi:hypothetical protein